jgi:hypothetical protein
MVRGGVLIGQDKRGVSALFLARELAMRYDTAWLMAHKLRQLRRAATRSTITYRQLVDGIQLSGAFPALTG